LLTLQLHEPPSSVDGGGNSGGSSGMKKVSGSSKTNGSTKGHGNSNIGRYLILQVPVQDIGGGI